jgi:hypothetical protein
MGFLDSGAGSDMSGSEGAESTEAADTAAPESTGADTMVAVEPTEAPKTERVYLKKAERSARVKDELGRKIADLESSVSKRDAEYRAQLAERDTELGRLRGTLETLAPMIQQRQQDMAPKKADPDQLMREAGEALDKQDLEGYHRKFAEAIIARMPQPPPQQQYQPQGPSPEVQVLLAKHENVARAGERGKNMVIAHDNLLAARGIAGGYDRWSRAFAAANTELAQEAGPQFSQQSRGVLSGVPTTRNQGSGEEGPGVTLNSDELKWAAAAGMSKSEYVKYLLEGDPNRLEK